MKYAPLLTAIAAANSYSGFCRGGSAVPRTGNRIGGFHARRHNGRARSARCGEAAAGAGRGIGRAPGEGRRPSGAYVSGMSRKRGSWRRRRRGNSYSGCRRSGPAVPRTANRISDCRGGRHNGRARSPRRGEVAAGAGRGVGRTPGKGRRLPGVYRGGISRK